MRTRFSLYQLLVWLLLPANAYADPSGCPGWVDHISIEERHDKPYPILLPPDVLENEDTPEVKAEWNYMSNVPEDDNTVHCYPTKNSHEKIDILLPKGIKKCTFYKNRFWCE